MKNFLRPAFLSLFLTVSLSLSAPLSAETFDSWLENIRQEASTKGISPATLSSLDGLTLDEEILRLANRQPEYVRPPWAYLDTMVSQKRKETGLELLATHQDIFTAIEAKYLVDKELLAAIWGIETNFGTYQGKKHILRALATLGHQGGRRKAFGRQQLLAALEIVEAGDITGDNIYGSWAGAMGQTQFIPTTYLAYAVDFDGDGRRDVWQSKKDALGSAANYLAISGWDMTQRWGYEVTLPAGFDYRQADLKKTKPISAWQALGVRGLSLSLPDTDADAAVFLPAGYRGPAFLVTQNFRAILRYNTAPAYALAAGLLSDYYKGLAGVQTPWPIDERPLHRAEIKELQTKLNSAGFAIGKVDGLLGRRTKAAIRDFQAANGLVPDGHATPSLLSLLP